MKRTKLLSFLLAGVLLFQTAGTDVLATAPTEAVPTAETVQEPSGETTDPLPQDSEETQTPENDETEKPETPEKVENKVSEPAEPEEDADNNPTPGQSDTDTPGEETDTPREPEVPGADEEQPPASGEENISAPGEENTEPGSVESPKQPIEDEPGEEAPEEPEKAADEKDAAIDSISENTVSENTVSENTLPEEEENIFDIFPGLGDNYTLTAQQLAEKHELSNHMGDIVDMNSVRENSFPDAEGLYELGEVVYLADTEAEARQSAEAFGGKLASYSYGVAVISLPENATVAMAITAAADSDIKLPAVWPNYYNYADSSTDLSTDSFSIKDPAYSRQWQHDYIGTRYAWAAGYTGQGVTVAVIDSGVQTDHEDLSGVTGKLFVSKEGTVGSAYDTDNGNHGTHVAGIIAATATIDRSDATANDGKDNTSKDDDGAGIAPEASLRSYCVMSKASGGRSANSADIMRAVNAAVADGNDIINMSLGGPMYSALDAAVIKKAYEKGVAVFASAGNDDSDGYNFPAAYPGSISVAAVDENGARASFSNFGSTVTLAFPGVNIYSTVPTGYGIMSGTSQASPAAAGTAAVILSADDSIRKKTGKARVDALVSRMKSSTTKSSGSGMGAGTTWLPGVLNIATDATAPDAPVITIAETPSPKDRSGKTYIAEAVTVTLTAKTAASSVDIWYSTDGKTPSYKNGAVTNAVKYTAPFPLSGAKSKTIKAIAINTRTGMASKAASKTCILTPVPTAVTLTSAGNVSRIAAGKSLKLTAAVTPSYAVSNKVAWSVDSAAKAAGITVSNGTLKTKAATPAGKYTVTATAVGNDGASYNGVTGTYELTVIAKADIKKVAFLDGKGKTYNKTNLNIGSTLDMKPYLKVTKLDNSAGAVTDVVWSSSNPGAAVVSSEGIVTAMSPGKAVIKATSNDGGNKSASCTVTVNQPIESITLRGSSKVAAGKSITLKADVAPKNATNKKLTWAVTGNSNVTVSANGKVTAKKGASGSCTVTATAKDGSAVSAAYTVTILSGMITKITLSDKSVNLFSTQVNGQTPASKALTAAVAGSGNFDKTLIEWTSSAPGIASVDNGIVTAHTAGKATITCTAADGSNRKATCTVNVQIPMSKLVIGATGRNGYAGSNETRTSYIAQGKSIRLSAHYYSYCGKPTSTKITWHSSNEKIVQVDKNGKVTAAKDAAVNSSAKITATAADGSNVVSNSYVVTVSPLCKKMTLEYDSRVLGWVPVLQDASGREYTVSYFTVSVSGGKNPGCYKGNYDRLYYLQPIPGAQTTSKSSGSSTLTARDLLKMKLKVTLQDGSGLSATTTANAARFSNGTVKYYFPKR